MSDNTLTAEKSAVPTEPRDKHYTYEFEPPAQGGGRYIVCLHCGREHISERPDRIVHQADCPLADR
jgi:hypothetical protein